MIGLATNLEAQRAALADLSEELTPFFEKGLSTGTLYVQHCPMAFDGAGADWLSERAAIRNPYFGEAMLTCGYSTDTLGR